MQRHLPAIDLKPPIVAKPVADMAEPEGGPAALRNAPVASAC